MSTYLVAFIVGEFDFLEDTICNDLKVRKEQGKFALDVAVKSLPFYEKFFSVSYPLPKMDLIAIADFASQAMENWGLVTFRETCLLCDEKNTVSQRKQWISLVVAHESAHQWFVLLNICALQICIPNLIFVTDVTSGALAFDGLHSSHPIEVSVGPPHEVTEIFDAISYNKGAAVIRMLYEYIGDECFSKVLSLYLKKHSYGNTVTEDLWAALEEVSKKPIGKIMSTWTMQKEFPVIPVNSLQEGNNRILTLSQEKFCSNGKLSEEDKKVLWIVPISISTQSDPSKEAFKVLLESKNTEVVLNGVSAND
ncbi:puromycin-sensitive aminopeptidase-like isoform X2 [Leptotrombidium deliense]|uniref:Puromycin-sensitive aminopeptidase-like isoform X2 n=1 Tax=Leptotrombidium deliense TaxID=299467 RepID=A0A443RX55_9ACAR|nr:puromycin-sensitive aminopeptidase-like isoform X2 [Leptotrombidium deliense]